MKGIFVEPFKPLLLVAASLPLSAINQWIGLIATSASAVYAILKIYYLIKNSKEE